MKKFVILSIIFLFSALILTGCILEPSIKEKDVLTMAKERGKFIVGVSYDTKPLSFLNSNNQPEGFEIEIAKNIAKTILGDENAIEYVQTNGYNSISLVSSGKVDFLISSTTITPQRQIVVAFSTPYYKAGQAILVKQDSKIHTLKDLNKKKVIFHLNTTAEVTLKKYLPTANKLGFKTFKECSEAFKNGEGDAIISDDALLRGIILENNSAYRLLPQRFSIEMYGIVMKNTENSKSLQAEINNVIETMTQTKELDNLKEKWRL